MTSSDKASGVLLKAPFEQQVIIAQIALRAKELLKLNHSMTVCIQMDITATHLNGCPLRLSELLYADDFNFLHDITGIFNHLDRSNGQLSNCFLPRFSL